MHTKFYIELQGQTTSRSTTTDPKQKPFVPSPSIWEHGIIETRRRCPHLTEKTYPSDRNNRQPHNQRTRGAWMLQLATLDENVIWFLLLLYLSLLIFKWGIRATWETEICAEHSEPSRRKSGSSESQEAPISQPISQDSLPPSPSSSRKTGRSFSRGFMLSEQEAASPSALPQ